MTPHRKKCPHVVHFNVPRDWFELNSRHQKRYSEDGKKFRECRGLLRRVRIQLFRERFSYKSVKANATMSKVIMGNGGFTVA